MSVLCVAPLYSTLVPRNLLSPDSFHSNYRLLHSFPTRRSSDLSVQRWARANAARTFRANKVAPSVDENTRLKDMDEFVAPLRSEEHTSELQSRGHLVCRLLLEKKK